MGRKNSPSAKKELVTLITNYEEAKAENRQLYLDADQLAGIADWYASERKFEEAQEVITYGLKIHPRNTDLLIEQAYLYLDTQKLQKAKKVADSITEEFDSEVKLLKAELLLNGGKLEEAQWLLSTIADADELETIIDVVFLYLDMGYPDAAKEWLDRGKSRYTEDEEYMALTADYLASTHQVESAIIYYNKLNDRLSDEGAYGVDPGKHLLSSFGANLKGEAKYEFLKNMTVYSRLDLYSDYLHKPLNIDVNWEVQVNMIINKWFSTTLTTNLMYDDDVKIVQKDGTKGARVQFKEILGVGVQFNF
jgi:tetratricopeptide (TPR) repeat protein